MPGSDAHLGGDRRTLDAELLHPELQRAPIDAGAVMSHLTIDGPAESFCGV